TLSSFIALLILATTVDSRYRCKGINGKQVDWFVAYKLPTAVLNANGGKNFVYADSDNPEWQLSRKTIDEEDSAIGSTVSQAYGNDSSSFVLMYSDDGPATPVDSYRGHAKGVLVFDGSTGFWLVHSVPNFPGLTSYIYPPTGFKFAQSFLCVSVATDNLAAIGEQLMFVQATPFKSQLPEKFATKFPVLRTVLAKRSLPQSATVFSSTKHIQTEGGTAFHAYAKHKKYQKDLWHDLVALDMGVSLGVQTWPKRRRRRSPLELQERWHQCVRRHRPDDHGRQLLLEQGPLQVGSQRCSKAAGCVRRRSESTEVAALARRRRTVPGARGHLAHVPRHGARRGGVH
ncbi:hypothetical protein PFISCL1PPCAC_3971, partial [Pristionchus fissidentatus]